MKHPLWIERHTSTSFIPIRAAEAPCALNVCLPIIPIMLAPQRYRLFRKMCPHISRIPTFMVVYYQRRSDIAELIKMAEVRLIDFFIPPQTSSLDFHCGWTQFSNQDSRLDSVIEKAKSFLPCNIQDPLVWPQLFQLAKVNHVRPPLVYFNQSCPQAAPWTWLITKQIISNNQQYQRKGWDKGRWLAAPLQVTVHGGCGSWL